MLKYIFAFEEGGVKSAFVFGGFSFFFLLFSVDELMTIPKNERDLDNLHYLLLVEFTILNLCRYSSIALLYVTFTTMGEARIGPEVGGPTSTNTCKFYAALAILPFWLCRHHRGYLGRLVSVPKR